MNKSLLIRALLGVAAEMPAAAPAPGCHGCADDGLAGEDAFVAPGDWLQAFDRRRDFTCVCL